MSQTSSPAVVIHIPHASTVIPPKYRNQFVLSDENLAAELVRMTDAYTEELFALARQAATTVKFAVSRLVLDPERFEDDQQESMASCSMGVIYQYSSLCGPLSREISGDEREALLARFYRPHHQVLTEAVQKSLDSHGKCLIMDAHSFGSKPWPQDPDQTSTWPEICLNTDDFHLPRNLTKIDCGGCIQIPRLWGGPEPPVCRLFGSHEVLPNKLERLVHHGRGSGGFVHG